MGTLTIGEAQSVLLSDSSGEHLVFVLLNAYTDLWTDIVWLLAKRVCSFHKLISVGDTSDISEMTGTHLIAMR